MHHRRSPATGTLRPVRNIEAYQSLTRPAQRVLKGGGPCVSGTGGTFTEYSTWRVPSPRHERRSTSAAAWCRDSACWAILHVRGSENANTEYSAPVRPALVPRFPSQWSGWSKSGNLFVIKSGTVRPIPHRNFQWVSSRDRYLCF